MDNDVAAALDELARRIRVVSGEVRESERKLMSEFSAGIHATKERADSFSTCCRR
jgi:hypothetical protein